MRILVGGGSSGRRGAQTRKCSPERGGRGYFRVDGHEKKARQEEKKNLGRCKRYQNIGVIKYRDGSVIIETER